MIKILKLFVSCTPQKVHIKCTIDTVMKSANKRKKQTKHLNNFSISNNIRYLMNSLHHIVIILVKWKKAKSTYMIFTFYSQSFLLYYLWEEYTKAKI